MNNEERREILLAISLGWKSPSEFKDLPEYSDELFINELKSLQNDLSLLPATLLIENPPALLKDKVARKLYRIKDEIRLKVKESVSTPKETPGEKTIPVFPEIAEANGELTREVQNPDQATETDIILGTDSSDLIKMNGEFEEVDSLENVSSKLESQLQEMMGKVKKKASADSSNLKIDEPGIIISEEENGTELNIPQSNKYNIQHEPEIRRSSFEAATPKEKSYFFQITAFILFFIVTLGLVFMYFKFSSEVDKYQMQVDHLNQQFSALSSQFEGNSTLQDILNSKELRIVNLQRTNKMDNGFVKIFLDPSQGRGVLQLSELPAIEEGKAYHLWGNVGADFYSLTVFTFLQRMDFKNFTFSDFLIQPGSKFLLIEDPDDKTDAPGNKILFEGTVE